MASHAYTRFPPLDRPPMLAPPSAPPLAPRPCPPAPASPFRPKLPTLSEAMRGRHRDSLADIDAFVRASSVAADVATKNAQGAYARANEIISRYASSRPMTQLQEAASDAACQAAVAAGKAMAKANEASVCAMDLHAMAIDAEKRQMEATAKVMQARIVGGEEAIRGIVTGGQRARGYPGVGAPR